MTMFNPFGKLGLEETLQKIALFLQHISNNVGKMYPDTAGRTRVSIDAGTLPTVTTLTNQTQQSGFQTSYDQYAQIQMCAHGIRSQIKVS